MERRISDWNLSLLRHLPSTHGKPLMSSNLQLCKQEHPSASMALRWPFSCPSLSLCVSQVCFPAGHGYGDLYMERWKCHTQRHHKSQVGYWFKLNNSSLFAICSAATMSKPQYLCKHASVNKMSTNICVLYISSISIIGNPLMLHCL